MLSREYQVVRIDVHICYSLVKSAFASARTIEEYDVTMPVPRICLTSQIIRGDVTMQN